MGKLITGHHRIKIIRKLQNRDGSHCFYCGKPFLKRDDITVEHLLSKVCGGPNTQENLALACAPCNTLAGQLPVVQKIQLRDSLRAGK